MCCLRGTLTWSIWNSFARVPRTIVGKIKGKVRCTLHRTEPKRTGEFLYLLVVFSELFRNNNLDSAPLKQVIWSSVSRPKGIFKKLSKLRYYLKRSVWSEDPAHRCAKRSESTRNELAWGEMDDPPPSHQPLFQLSVELHCELSRVA